MYPFIKVPSLIPIPSLNDFTYKPHQPHPQLFLYDPNYGSQYDFQKQKTENCENDEVQI
jgi:hypothetical protein